MLTVIWHCNVIYSFFFPDLPPGSDDRDCSICNETRLLSPGDDLLLPCNVAGHPQPDLEWSLYFNCSTPLHALNATKATNDIANTTAVLSLFNVKKEDEGLYKCKASYLDVAKTVNCLKGKYSTRIASIV